MKKLFKDALYPLFKYACILAGGMIVSEFVARKVVFEEKEDL